METQIQKKRALASHDRQRMNVALTRAKYALLVVGRKTSLDTSVMWCDFIAHAQQNGEYIMVDETKLSQGIAIPVKVFSQIITMMLTKTKMKSTCSPFTRIRRARSSQREQYGM